MQRLHRSHPVKLLGLLVLALALVSVAGCGGDDEQSGTAQAPKGNPADRAFLSAMVPHHTSAVEMAALTGEKAEHSELKGLGEEITTAQEDEIEKMMEIHQRLFGAALKPDEGAHEALGLSPEQAGMAHMDGAKKLQTATPFGRAFIDEMVPHHQGAIRMARAVMSKTKDDEVRSLAEDIVGAQTKEIEEMNDWRTEWYGAPSPAGGVPPEGEKMPTMGGEHNTGH